MTNSLGIGVIGMGWMGEVHSRAWRGLSERFHHEGISADLVVCADDVEARAKAVQQRFGFADFTTDWKRVIDDHRVNVVVATVPNNLHQPVSEAAVSAGKHIFCEKPVGRNPQEVSAIATAARNAGVVTGVGFNYRYAPMAQHARQLIQSGALGDITHYRGRFLVDYGSDPNGVLSWRFQRDIAGWGVMGDIMSHVVDMAIQLVGPIARVTAREKTMIAERPLAQRGEGSHFSVGSGEKAPVTNEDYVGALVDFKNDVVGTFEVSRVSKGHDCEMAFEVNGTNGSLRWNYERLNELELRLPEGNSNADGWTKLQAGPQHPDFGVFYPGPGNAISYDDLKGIEVSRFARSVIDGKQGQPGFDDMLSVARVLDAMQQSSNEGTWTEVETQ